MNTERIIKIALDLVDMEKLPSDSAVHVPGSDIQRVLYGIDIGSAELYYAKDAGYDAVITHHPVGLVDYYKVFRRHQDQLVEKGVPHEEARKVVEEKLPSLKVGAHARNYAAIPAFAQLIGMPFLNIHCPSDELGRRLINHAIEDFMEKESHPSLQSVASFLEATFPEFQNAKTKIEVIKGDSTQGIGKWVFSHGALTNGGFSIANLYFQNHIDTVIYIHIAPTELARILTLDYGQLIITGHLASDSIGINPFLDNLEEEGIEVTAIGGMIRI
ncbi:MAG: hypothetical protein ACFFFG_13840 [Candidatus Thorarchaeota archaeon]